MSNINSLKSKLPRRIHKRLMRGLVKYANHPSVRITTSLIPAPLEILRLDLEEGNPDTFRHTLFQQCAILGNSTKLCRAGCRSKGSAVPSLRPTLTRPRLLGSYACVGAVNASQIFVCRLDEGVHFMAFLSPAPYH